MTRIVDHIDTNAPEATGAPRSTRHSVRSRSPRSQRQRGIGAAWGWYLDKPVWAKVAIGAPLVAAGLILLFGLIEVLASAGRVHPGVRVAGVSVGGLTTAGATEAVDEKLTARMSEPVELQFEDESWTYTAEDVGAELDAEATVEQAMAIGRTGSFGRQLGARIRAWFDPVELTAVVVADEELTEVALDAIDASVTVAPQDATVVIEGTDASIEPAEVGMAMRRDVVRDDLLSSFASEARLTDVAVEFVPVSVTEADAEHARIDALKMMSAPVKVTYENDTWTFQADEIAEWIDFRPVPVVVGTATADATGTATATVESLDCTASIDCSDGTHVTCATTSTAAAPRRMMLEAFISADEASATVEKRVGAAGKEAKNATFKTVSGKVQIVPHQDGVGPDVEALAQTMSRVLLEDGERTVELRTTRVQPERTTEDAKQMGINQRISTYTTTYSSGNAPRVNNIHTLADSLDGTLLAPGATFSFNDTVGPRTADRGYQEAGAIVNGELVPQLGGGICQVNTTLFNTVYESGLPVVQRRNHSFYISHYPKGRDATVSWGGPDFKFRNDTDHYVLIATGYSNSSVTISLYGTDPGYSVTSDVGPWTNVKPYPTKEIKDPTLEEGKQVTEDGGVNGRTIVVTRTVKKGGTVVREDEFRSVYKPKQAVVRVGTKKPEPVATETVPPAAP